MKKFYTIMGIFAGLTLTIGIVFLAIGIGMGGLKKTYEKTIDFLNLDLIINPQCESLDYTVVEEFHSIDIDMAVGEVKIVKGTDYAMEYCIYGGIEYEIADGVLNISCDDADTIEIGLSFTTKDTYITVYVPENADINRLDVASDIGDISIEDIKAWDVIINVDVGNVLFDEVAVGNLDIESDIGNVIFKGNTAGIVNIGKDTGNVEMTGYLASDITIEADTGNVEVTTYYDVDTYTYIAKTDLGTSEINIEGGESFDDEFNIVISSDTGNVELTFTDN